MKHLTDCTLSASLHDAIKEAMLETADLSGHYWESWQDAEEMLDDIAHEHYSGFIPFTNGGWRAMVPLNLADLVSKGAGWPGHYGIAQKLDAAEAYSYECALESFEMMCADDLEGIPRDKWNYSELYELGRGDLAETLSECEHENLQSVFWIEYRAIYYAADNPRNETGRDEVYFYAGVNLDFEYGRDSGLIACYEETLSVADLSRESIRAQMIVMRGACSESTEAGHAHA